MTRMRIVHQRFNQGKCRLVTFLTVLSIFLFYLLLEEKHLRRHLEDMDGTLRAHVLATEVLHFSGPSTTQKTTLTKTNLHTVHSNDLCYSSIVDFLYTDKEVKVLKRGCDPDNTNAMWLQHFSLSRGEMHF